MVEVKCANCGKTIHSPKKNSRFCAGPGSTCRQEYHRLHSTPRAAVDAAIGRWFTENKALLVAALTPDLVREMKQEVRRLIRLGRAAKSKKRKPR